MGNPEVRFESAKAMDRRLVATLGLGFVLAGCGSKVAPPYPVWASPPPRSDIRGTGTMFDCYASAALKVQADASQYTTRVFFTPDRKKAAIEKVEPALAMVIQGTKLPSEFKFSAQPPFEANPYQPGWQLLGKVLVWRIEDAVEQNDGAKAVSLTLTATQFGFDLCGGGATDASLGLSIVDEARRAIAPALERFQSSDLLALAAGIEAAMKRRPPIVTTIRNERENMMMAVQTVQDAYRDQTLNSLVKELGPDVQSAVDYLDGLRPKDAKSRPAYFEGFVAEAESEVRNTESAAQQPTAKRQKPDKRTEERPWRKFAKQFFRTLMPLLALNDATTARTRLLVLEARALAQVKRANLAPKDLSFMSSDVATDPYTGDPFVYRADGDEFRVYSVGSDFRDDGGDTDESFTSPDLKLERRPGG